MDHPSSDPGTWKGGSSAQAPSVPALSDPGRFERERARIDDGFGAKVRRTLGRVPFIEDAVAAYFCARDPHTPFQVKAVIMGALAYFVVPSDMIPDFIAAFGFTDDAAVFYAALRTIAPHITADHRARARRALLDIDAAPHR